MAEKMIMPEMGEGVIEGTVTRWLKEEGDPVELFEPVLEIETDKVTTEATAESEGVLLKIMVPAGETVDVGTVLAYIGEPGETPPPAKANEAQPPPEPAAAGRKTANGAANGRSQPQPAPTPTDKSGQRQPGQPYTGRISPVVGRIAEEHSVDLAQVMGTGRNGRITKNDILAYVEEREKEPAPVSRQPAAEPGQPALPTRAVALSQPPTPSPQSPSQLVPLTGMRRAIAEHMVRSKKTSPHVTTVFEFDFTAVAAHRRAHKEQFARDGARLTFTAYIVAATVAALKQHPLANSSWTDDGIQLQQAINIGMATALDEGLIVPVIKDADSLNLLGIARAVNDLAERARSKQLKPQEVQGGTFSITNHGVTGSILATPIINQPQCGILGVGMIEKRVKVIDDAIAIRPLAYVSFTFDHRILDGATADRFVAEIKRQIENW